MIENATGRKSDDLLIGNNASNRLKGKKGDDVLYASTGSKNRLIGGKGRDKFLIDSDQEAFVVVKDFNHQKDRLAFNIPPPRQLQLKAIKLIAKFSWKIGL